MGVTVLLAGATGLVGRECLDLLIADATVSRIVVIARRSIGDKAQSPKIAEHVIDFARLREHASLFAVQRIFCALGTTIKQAGSQERFREVDFDYPLEIGRLGVEQGASHFLLVSALSANSRSRVFYSRVKGEIEEAVRALPYRSVTIVRPSILLGDRAEVRPGERLASRLGFLVPRRYKPVHARDVARALGQAARDDAPGVRVIDSGELHGQR